MQLSQIFSVISFVEIQVYEDSFLAAGMAIIAVANLALAWRGDFPERESYDPKAVALILGGFAGLIAIIALGGGFIPATAVLFAATAAAAGRSGFF